MLFFSILIGSVAAGLGVYLGTAAFFEWFYYRRRYHEAFAWKCQPGRWTPKHLNRSNLVLGVLNLSWMSLVSGILVHRIIVDNPTQVYLHGHGSAFSSLTAFAFFLVTDLALYWMHRLYHKPTLYRLIHHRHHRTGAPTVLSAMASHPVEFAIYLVLVAAPLFVIPVHAYAAIGVVVLHNAAALASHSGVRFSSSLPIQPQFHDDHHQYVTFNYGQTLQWWDRLFGTCRQSAASVD